MKSNLKQNIIYNAIYQIFITLLPIITIPYISRKLSPEQIGEYNYIISMMQIFIIISFFGINTYGTREIVAFKSKKERSAAFWNIWIVQIIFSIISFIIFHLLANFNNEINSNIFKLQSVLILINMFEVSWFFIGIEELKKVVLRNGIIKIIFTLSIFLLIKDESDFNMYILLNVLSVLIGNIILIKSLKKYISFEKIVLKDIMKNIKGTYIFLLPQISILIYTSLDQVILGNLSDMVQVAYYTQSQKLVRISTSIVSSVGVALLPRMTHYINKNEMKKFNELFHNSMQIILLLSFYIVTMIVCFSDSFVPWFFSEKYLQVILLMKIVAPIGIVIPIATLLWNTILIPMRKDKVAIKSGIYSAIISVVLNLILIRYLGALGAIITLVIVEIFGMSYRLYFSKEYIDFKKLIPCIFKYITAFVVSFIVAILINKNLEPKFTTTIIIIFIDTLIYFGVLLVLKENIVLEYINKGIVILKKITNKLSKS